MQAKQKRGKSPQSTQPFEIIGETQTNDNVDISRLRQVEFDQVDIYDPARFDGLVKLNPINDRPEIDYNLHLEKTIIMHLELDPESTEPADQIAIEEPINLKIYKGKDGLKIELSSEADVQLYYRATYKEENFRQI
jgi:hypothetical protein